MRRFLLKSLLALSGLLAVTTQGHAVEVYLFKGAGDFSFINKGLHFSKGLERMAKELNADGIHAEVRRYGAIDDAISTIRKRKPESVAFIGHSMGALASLGMAKKMKSMGVRVAYIGLIDIPGPVGVAGDNVEWAENYYSTFPVYGMLTNARSHPKAKNIHVSGQIHTTMDDSKAVRDGMLAALRNIQSAERQQFQQPQYVASQDQPLNFNDRNNQNINHSGDIISQSGVNQNEYFQSNEGEFLRPSVEVSADALGLQQIDPSTTASINNPNSAGMHKIRVKKPTHYTKTKEYLSNR